METLGIVDNSPQERGLNEWVVRPHTSA